MLGNAAVLQKRTLSALVFVLALLIPKFAFSLTCGQTTFAGTWRGAGDGVVCDLQIATSGSVGGSCYSEAVGRDRGRITIERVRLSGFIGVVENCELSGRFEMADSRSTTFFGHAWSAATGRPDVARIISGPETGAALYLIRASSGQQNQGKSPKS